MSMNSLTHDGFTQALIGRHKKGDVTICLVVDYTQMHVKCSSARKLL